MLGALLELARGEASEKTRAALAERVAFDASNGSGYIKTFSAQIADACKSRLLQAKYCVVYVPARQGGHAFKES